MKCITQAWDQNENELRLYLQSKLPTQQIAEDILQDVFVKAIINVDQFCTLENPRAWLYRVVKNSVSDHYRQHKETVPVDEQIPIEKESEAIPVVILSKCLPNALNNLSEEDKEVIELCNIKGLKQAEYAKTKKLTLSGAKSKILRARKKLKAEIHELCKVKYDDQGNVCCFDSNC